jgi:hypothetical protein
MEKELVEVSATTISDYFYFPGTTLKRQSTALLV